MENKLINSLATNTFFIEVNEQERQTRIIKRNLVTQRNEGETKGKIIEKLKNIVFPMHEKYVESKKGLTNLIIDNTSSSNNNIEIKAQRIVRFIKNKINFSNDFP